jgi:hypothetical protein
LHQVGDLFELNVKLLCQNVEVRRKEKYFVSNVERHPVLQIIYEMKI